jgi:hypothetical protein
MNFCVCCFMISEVSRMVEACSAVATVQLAISVPEVSVLWNFGVYSFSVVHHVWSSRTAWAVSSNDACSAISKILHLLVICLCVIVCTAITLCVSSLGLYRTWSRRLNHRWLLNNNAIQKWSRHAIWQLSLPHFVVPVTCARIQWKLKKTGKAWNRYVWLRIFASEGLSRK